MTPQLEMEEGRPDKGQKASGEVSDEPHEDGEVRDDDGEYDGDDDHDDTEAEAPGLEVAVQGPDGGEDGVGLALRVDIRGMVNH